MSSCTAPGEAEVLLAVCASCHPQWKLGRFPDLFYICATFSFKCSREPSQYLQPFYKVAQILGFCYLQLYCIFKVWQRTLFHKFFLFPSFW